MIEEGSTDAAIEAITQRILRDNPHIRHDTSVDLGDR